MLFSDTGVKNRLKRFVAAGNPQAIGVRPPAYLSKNTLSNILFVLIISAESINVNKGKEFKMKVQKFNEKV